MKTIKICVCDVVKVREGTPMRVIRKEWSAPVFVWDFSGAVVSPDSSWAPTLARAPSTFDYSFANRQSA